MDEAASSWKFVITVLMKAVMDVTPNTVISSSIVNIALSLKEILIFCASFIAVNPI